MKLHIECICGLHTTILSIDFSYHKLNWFPCSYTLVGTSNLVWRWHIQSGMHTAQTIRSSCKNIIDVTPSYDITQNYTVISARQSGHYKFFSTLYTSYKRWDRVECILQSFSFARSHIFIDQQFSRNCLLIIVDGSQHTIIRCGSGQSLEIWLEWNEKHHRVVFQVFRAWYRYIYTHSSGARITFTLSIYDLMMDDNWFAHNTRVEWHMRKVSTEIANTENASKSNDDRKRLAQSLSSS